MITSIVKILVASALIHVSFTQDLKYDSAQAMADKIVNVTLADVAEKYKNVEDGGVSLPNMTYDLVGNVKFTAVNGVFRDVRTLRKNKDVFVAKNGNKYTILFEVELGVANIYYPEYEVGYSILSKGGSINGTVDGIAMETTVSADYNSKPCTLKLEKVEITKFGEINVDITGFGELSKFSSKIVKLISKYKKDQIKSYIEKKVMTVIADSLLKVECEKYRP